MYISRNSIVIKTNYETRRRDRDVAGCRGDAQPEDALKSIRFVCSSKIQRKSITRCDRSRLRKTIRPDLSLRRKDTTTPSRDHLSGLRAIYVKSAFILLESLISVN